MCAAIIPYTTAPSRNPIRKPIYSFIHSFIHCRVVLTIFTPFILTCFFFLFLFFPQAKITRPRIPLAAGAEGGRFHRVLPADRDGADLRGEAGVAKLLALHRTDPVEQATGRKSRLVDRLDCVQRVFSYLSSQQQFKDFSFSVYCVRNYTYLQTWA